MYYGLLCNNSLTTHCYVSTHLLQLQPRQSGQLLRDHFCPFVADIVSAHVEGGELAEAAADGPAAVESDAAVV